MRICVATSGNGGLLDRVSTNFGRSPYFTVVEIGDNREIKGAKVVKNPGASAGSGAGVQAAQVVVDNECNVVIAGAIGPNSFQILKGANLDIRECEEMKVEDAIEQYFSGKLIASAGGGSGMGHGGHGMGMRRGGGPW
ncbi:MAG: NifB/NifX family molybdenum-iron cluster-binding protein [Thermoplasmata archaeon]